MTFVLRGHNSTMISGGTWTPFFARYSKTSLRLGRGIGFGSKSIASQVCQLVLFPLSSDTPLPLGSSAVAIDFLFTIFKVEADHVCRNEDEEEEKARGLKVLRKTLSPKFLPNLKRVLTSPQ